VAYLVFSPRCRRGGRDGALLLRRRRRRPEGGRGRPAETSSYVGLGWEEQRRSCEWVGRLTVGPRPINLGRQTYKRPKAIPLFMPRTSWIFIFLIYFFIHFEKYMIVSKFRKTNLLPPWSMAVGANRHGSLW
jgi:hypothetical protein